CKTTTRSHKSPPKPSSSSKSCSTESCPLPFVLEFPNRNRNRGRRAAMRMPLTFIFLPALLWSAPLLACSGAVTGEAERQELLKLPDVAPERLQALGVLAANPAEKASVYFHQDALLEA